MTSKTSNNSHCIPLDSQAVIDTPDRPAAINKKELRHRSAVVKMHTTLREWDPTKKNEQYWSKVKTLDEYVEKKFDSDEAFLDSFERARLTGHTISVANECLCMIKSYSTGYVSSQIALAKDNFDLSIGTTDKTTGWKIFEIGRAAFEAVGMLAFKDRELMNLHNKAHALFNDVSDNQVKMTSSNNEVKLSDNLLEANKMNNDLKKHESDNQVQTNKMNNELKKHESDNQVETNKMNIGLKELESNNELEAIKVQVRNEKEIDDSSAVGGSLLKDGSRQADESDDKTKKAFDITYCIDVDKDGNKVYFCIDVDHDGNKVYYKSAEEHFCHVERARMLKLNPTASAELIDEMLREEWIKMEDDTNGKSHYHGLESADLKALTETYLNQICPNGFGGPRDIWSDEEDKAAWAKFAAGEIAAAAPTAKKGRSLFDIAVEKGILSNPPRPHLDRARALQKVYKKVALEDEDERRTK